MIEKGQYGVVATTAGRHAGKVGFHCEDVGDQVATVGLCVCASPRMQSCGVFTSNPVEVA